MISHSNPPLPTTRWISSVAKGRYSRMITGHNYSGCLRAKRFDRITAVCLRRENTYYVVEYIVVSYIFPEILSCVTYPPSDRNGLDLLQVGHATRSKEFCQSATRTLSVQVLSGNKEDYGID
jgi:hypothetical protein